MKRLQDAVASFDRAIALRPDCAEAYLNQAYLLILRGDFARGWALHEWRWKREDYRPFLRNFTEPLWLGAEALAGKTVLLHAEQGLGDTFQFCRYALLAVTQGAKVIVAAAATQVELLRTLSPGITVIGDGLCSQ